MQDTSFKPRRKKNYITPDAATGIFPAIAETAPNSLCTNDERSARENGRSEPRSESESTNVEHRCRAASGTLDQRLKGRVADLELDRSADMLMCSNFVSAENENSHSIPRFRSETAESERAVVHQKNSNGDELNCAYQRGNIINDGWRLPFAAGGIFSCRRTHDVVNACRRQYEYIASCQRRSVRLAECQIYESGDAYEKYAYRYCA